MECKKCKFKIYENMDRGLCCHACGRQDKQLNTYDWLADVPGNAESTDLVEVQFKHTRKGYFHNVNNLDLKKGDIVAVEANPGHDIGVVTLTGRLVLLQVKKANLRSEDSILRIYRHASESDMDKYHEAKSREHGTMIQSREIAKSLGLDMKIGDVEYQGDGNKAIFYYIADERVDFRKLIKVLAETFHVRIEMKQIGARQEAGRIGGTGPCGRELCCATWMNNFVSVSTNAARFQDISLNPQKLAGMCAKLKCCLNYEVDTYIEAGKRLPSKEIVLQTLDADYFHFKNDILAGEITYSTEKGIPVNLVTISAARAFEVIRMNKRGEKPEMLEDGEGVEPESSKDLLENESITRFDKSKKKRKQKAAKPKAAPVQQNADAPENNVAADAEQPAQTAAEESSEKPQRERRQGRQSRRNQGERPARRDQEERQMPKNEEGAADNEDRPQRKEREDKPQHSEREDRPQRGNREDRPQRREREDKPQRKERGERPQRKERGEKPQRGEHDERPRNRNQEDRPQRNAQEDKPQRNAQEDRQQRNVPEDRPQRNAQEEKPQHTENSHRDNNNAETREVKNEEN